MFTLFDSHCHLQSSSFDIDRPLILSDLRNKQVGCVVVGTGMSESMKAVTIAEENDNVWASVGLHPTDDPSEVLDLPAFTALARHPKVVAIGECGLDLFRGEKDTDLVAQKIKFGEQITVALEVDKPLIVHCRPTQGTLNAHEEMLVLLEEQILVRKNRLRAIIHFFTSEPQVAERYLSLGCFLSYPGPVTFTDMYDASIELTPIDRILVETDSPFAAPAPFRGKRNEPAFVEYVIDKISSIKKLPIETVQKATVDNAEIAFSLR